MEATEHTNQFPNKLRADVSLRVLTFPQMYAAKLRVCNTDLAACGILSDRMRYIQNCMDVMKDLREFDITGFIQLIVHYALLAVPKT